MDSPSPRWLPVPRAGEAHLALQPWLRAQDGCPRFTSQPCKPCISLDPAPQWTCFSPPTFLLPFTHLVRLDLHIDIFILPASVRPVLGVGSWYSCSTFAPTLLGDFWPVALILSHLQSWSFTSQLHKASAVQSRLPAAALCKHGTYRVNLVSTSVTLRLTSYQHDKMLKQHFSPPCPHLSLTLKGKSCNHRH